MFKNMIVIAKNTALIGVIQKRSDVNIVDIINNKDYIYDSISKNSSKIDTIFATEGIDGSLDETLIEILCEIKNRFNFLRIIYLTACDVDMQNESMLESLTMLLQCGIYDIYGQKKISPSIINDLIDIPKTFNDVKKYYYEKPRTSSKITELPKDSYFDDSIIEGRISEGKKNVIAISSIKPGTGKSFISTNIAADIARFGAFKKGTNKRPSVVVVEGDLQTLSVGTLLGIENDTYNLREALKRAEQIVTENGEMIGSYDQQEQYKKFVRKCCLPYRDQENLFAIVGSQLNFTEIGNISPYRYFYMIEVISEMFDVVIIDANSSLEHRTTGPILQLASQCYYVLDLDFNNVRSNLRYRQELANLGALSKVKYILNKAITQEAQQNFSEKLDFDEEKLKGSGFEIVGRVPMIDNVVVLNRMHEKVPIVYDTSYSTLLARMEFCELSRKIWPMSNVVPLKLELEELKKKNKRKH